MLLIVKTCQTEELSSPQRTGGSAGIRLYAVTFVSASAVLLGVRNTTRRGILAKKVNKLVSSSQRLFFVCFSSWMKFVCLLKL